MMGTATEYTRKITVSFPNVFTLGISNTSKGDIHLSEVGAGRTGARCFSNLPTAVAIYNYPETGTSTVKTF